MLSYAALLRQQQRQNVTNNFFYHASTYLRQTPDNYHVRRPLISASTYLTYTSKDRNSYRQFSTSKSPFWTLPFLNASSKESETSGKKKKNDDKNETSNEGRSLLEKDRHNIAGKEKKSLEEEAGKFNKLIASLIIGHHKHNKDQQPQQSQPSEQPQQQEKKKKGRFTEKIDWPELPELPSVNAINAKLAELYPQFTTQFNNLRDGYAKLWDYLTMEEFRRTVEEVKKEIQDPKLYPEITKDAIVREGNELSHEEKTFIQRRKLYQKQAFAHFIQEDPAHIDERDIPVIGIAASGGGYRAMVGLTGYLQAMKASGLLDCVMYFSGISGSCWSMALYYNTLTNADPARMKSHFQKKLNTHWANITNFIQMLTSSPKNGKMLLQGAIQRYSQQRGDMSFVDIFGVLMGGTLLTQKSSATQPTARKNSDKRNNDKEDGVKRKEPDSRKVLQLSQQADFLKDGAEPMPIYCVVRHDISNGKTVEERIKALKKEMGTKESKEDMEELKRLEKAKIASETDQHDAYQWFEFTPFDVGCEEIEAWVPIWGFGRQFEKGKSIERLPEQTLDILMGTFGSAFAASLVHFYQEIRTFLPSGSLDRIDEAITRYEATMSAYHPISPSSFPNPFYKLPQMIRSTSSEEIKDSNKSKEAIVLKRPDALIQSKELYLMDAGMDNNIPFYPLLREGRNVDIILAVDLSADIQTAPHFDRAESYVKRRGIEGWPTGAGWPKQQEADNDMSSKSQEPKYALGTCTIFETKSREEDLVTSKTGDSKVEDIVKKRKQPITLAYFPYIVNPHYDPEFDPQEAEFCSTWNFVYTPEQIDKAMGLANANWNDNTDRIKELLRKAWEKKKNERLQREEKENYRTDIYVDDLF